VAEHIRVELYTLSTCPWSRNARAWLDNHQVAYEFVDYDLADQGMQRHIQGEMVSRGAAAFPFVKFGETEFIIGFNPDAFARLLGLPRDAERTNAKTEDEPGSCPADFEAAAPDA
jgi:glutaredoxin